MCHIPTANPRSDPSIVNHGLVCHQRSNPTPIKGGSANSNPMVEIREAHCIPTDRIERGSGWFTGTSHVPPFGTRTGFDRNGVIDRRETSRHRCTSHFGIIYTRANRPVNSSAACFEKFFTKSVVRLHHPIFSGGCACAGRSRRGPDRRVTEWRECPRADTWVGFLIDRVGGICYDLRSELLRIESGTSQCGDLAMMSPVRSGSEHWERRLLTV